VELILAAGVPEIPDALGVLSVLLISQWGLPQQADAPDVVRPGNADVGPLAVVSFSLVLRHQQVAELVLAADGEHRPFSVAPPKLDLSTPFAGRTTPERLQQLRAQVAGGDEPSTWWGR